MRSMAHWLFCFAIIYCIVCDSFAFYMNRKSRDISSQSNTVASILDFLNSQDEKWLGKDRDVVIVLGNTGVGKSTLTTLLTNTTYLVSKGSAEAGEFLLADNHRISSDCTIESKTHIPELVKDSINQISYYDCPGFGDTRGLQYELAQTYFIRRILDNADSVKFLFVIDNGSMKKGGDRKNFPRLTKYATSVIKNLDKYRSGIALIITKVENTVIMEETEDGEEIYKLVDDDTKKKTIVSFLDEMKKDLRKTPSVENESIIKFIDIISEKSNGKYEKIGLFRMPNKAGPIEKIPLLRGVTKKLITIVDKHINYIQPNMSDFGFTLSAESMVTVRDKYDEVFQNLKQYFIQLNDDIITFYMNEDKQLVDIFALKRLMQHGYENISQINEPSVSRQFYDKIVYTMKNVAITVSGENLNNIARNIEYVKILSDVTNYNPVSTPELNLNKALNYLQKSSKWYEFLIELYESLSTYDAQNQLSTLKTSLNKMKLNGGLAEEIKVSDIGLKSFLEAINNNKYSSVENIQINAFELESLQDVLDQMMDNKMVHVCDSSTLIVTGRFIKISDVIKIACWSNTNNIQVFASNTIFIDADIDKSEKDAQITFIAPTWRVLGDRTINLNGKNATNYIEPATNGTKDANKNGSDGKIGITAGSAGHFFGIGKRFYDSNLLKVYAIGGNGGNGQQGGNGTDGIGPDTPPIKPEKNIPEMWKNMGLKYVMTSKTVDKPIFGPQTTNYWYDVYIKTNAVLPGKGGDGGAGGYGGLGGNVSIVGFWQTPNINISNHSGVNGAAGRGGNGGKGAPAEMKFSIQHSISHTSSRYTVTFAYYSDMLGNSTVTTQSNGKNGEIGAGQPNAVKNMDMTNRALLTVAYKDHTIEHMVESIVESEQRNFFQYLNEDNRIQSLFDPLSFIEEFLSLENHFIQLHNKLSLIPFHESLLQRIVAFDATKSDSIENKHIFNYLYSAVYSKIVAIKSNSNRNVVVDLPEYLSNLKDNINNLETVTNQMAVINQRDEYKKTLDDKIASANNIIETEVLPAIDSVYNSIDDQFDNLFRENIQKQNSAKASITNKHKEMLQLQKMMALRQSLFPIRIFGTLLPLIGKEGEIVGNMVNKLADLTEKYADQPIQNITTHENISKVLSKSIKQLNKAFDNRAKLLEIVLGKIKNDTKDGLDEKPNNKHLKEIDDKLTEITSKMEDKTDLENGIDDKNIRKEVSDFLEKKREEVKNDNENEIDDDGTDSNKDGENDGDKENDSKNKTEKKNTTANVIGYLLNNAQHAINVYDITVEHFDAIKEDEKKIQQVANAIKSMEDDIESLKEHEEKITTVMMTEIKRIKYNITESTADGQSIIDRHLKDWKMQNSIRVTKELFDKLTDEFAVQSELQESFNKIQNGLAFLADIFDRIDSYAESKNFAEYIANIAFGASKFKDPELNKAVTKLEKMIKSNIVLERYAVAIQSFQQHYFPFAHLFLERFNLPITLQLNDTEAIKNKAIEQINHLELESRLQKSTIGNYDKYITEMDDIVFYQWQNNSINHEMRKLLKGEQIVLTANIANGLNFDAVKFKNIGIQFVMQKPCKQGSFDVALKNFSVAMTLIGVNYYRCGNRFYSLPINDDITIEYSFGKNNDGKPKERNSVYKKIQQNEYFLSPYSMWSIQLDSNNDDHFDALAKFLNDDIHLQLIGDVQYLKHFPTEFCNEHVDKYYDLDKTLTVK